MRSFGGVGDFCPKVISLPAFRGMLRAKDYIVEFNKLRTGLNRFEFVLNGEFLRLAGDTSGLDADVKAEMTLFKTETMYTLHFHLVGKIILPCDVCLETFGLPVDTAFELLIKISETEKYDDDEIIYVTPQTIDYDLMPFLYDSLVLSVPIRKLCSMSGVKECNPEALKKLKDLSAEEPGQDESNDPRWDRLKGMFN